MEYTDFLQQKQKRLVQSGFELKESYYELAKKNLRHLLESKKQLKLA